MLSEDDIQVAVKDIDLDGDELSELYDAIRAQGVEITTEGDGVDAMAMGMGVGFSSSSSRRVSRKETKVNVQVCPDCGGAHVVTCPECGGRRASACRKCGGTGTKQKGGGL